MNSKVSRHFRSRYKLAIFCATTWVFDTTCVNPKWHMTCNIIITFMVIHHYFSLCQVRQVSVDCFPKMTLENVFWCPSESVTKQLWHSLEGTSRSFVKYEVFLLIHVQGIILYFSTSFFRGLLPDPCSTGRDEVF